jgi:hypothetical protein
MNKQKGFLLRLPEQERHVAKQLASELGYSENRLYSEIIHDGLLMREQQQYMAKLKNKAQVSTTRLMELLNKVPDVPAQPEDVLM